MKLDKKNVNFFLSSATVFCIESPPNFCLDAEQMATKTEITASFKLEKQLGNFWMISVDSLKVLSIALTNSSVTATILKFWRIPQLQNIYDAEYELLKATGDVA